MSYSRLKQSGSFLSILEQADTCGDGRLVVVSEGTAIQFPDTTCIYVLITALPTNTDVVLIGGSTVDYTVATRRGDILFAGQKQIYQVKNLNILYMDGKTGEGVSYAYFN